MRLVQILAGATLALVVAVTVASLVLAFAVWTIHHDASVVKAFEAGNLLAPVRRMLAHGREPGQGVPVAIALGAGSAAGIGFIVLLLTGRDGGARFQSRADLAAGGYLRANTMFVGRIGGLSLAWRAWKRDPDTKVLEQSVRRRLVGGTPVHMPDFGHALVSGPTRSGKGASLIIPNALEFPGSMVILDIRGETFERTAGWRARFSKVIKIAPSSLISHCYNPLDFVRRRPGFFEGDIMSIAGGLISSSTADKYWAKDAIELVAGVIGYVLEADGEPDKHLGAVMDVLVGRDNAQDRLREIIARHAATLSGFTLSKIVPFATMAEKQWNGVYGMVRTSLSPFNNATTRKVLSRSSFDLFAVRRTAHTLYVDFRLSQLSAMGSLCNVLVTQIMNHLTDDLRADGEHRVLFMLDEFTTLGEIAPLMGLLKVGAGNGVGVWAFVQSMTNVEEIYGKTGLDNFLDNIEAFIFLGGSSTSVLDHVERRLGKRVVHQKIRRRQAGGGRSISAGTSTEERPVEKSLMSIDELTRLDRRVAIVLPRGAGPIRLWRNYWFADHHQTRRATVPIPADLVPNLERGLPPSYLAAKAGSAASNALRPVATRPRPAAVINARLDAGRPPAADDGPAPGGRFLAAASIAARRAAHRVGPEENRVLEEPPVVAPAAEVPVAEASAVEIPETRFVSATLCGVPLREIWSADLASSITAAIGGEMLGDLLACGLDDPRITAALSEGQIGDARTRLDAFGVLGCRPRQWPVVASTPTLDRLRVAGKTAARVLAAEPKDNTPAGRKRFSRLQDDSLARIREMRTAGAEVADIGDDEVVTTGKILAQRPTAIVPEEGRRPTPEASAASAVPADAQQSPASGRRRSRPAETPN
jgi:type IV secretion system protein VirD4